MEADTSPAVVDDIFADDNDEDTSVKLDIFVDDDLPVEHSQRIRPKKPQTRVSQKQKHSGEKKNKLTTRQKRTTLGNKQSNQRRTMTPAKWQKYLELAANGYRRADIARILIITPETIQAHLISNVSAAKQMREAEAIWLRRKWDVEEIDVILNKVALGATVKAACIELEYDEATIGEFYSLMRRDPTMRDWYDSARELQAESWMDDSIDISDNRGEDTYVDARGNRKTDHGVVQRDRLRIETRWKSMGALNRKRFGEHKHIDHGGELQVNHAALLGNARKRLENTNSARTPATIEGTAEIISNE